MLDLLLDEIGWLNGEQPWLKWKMKEGFQLVTYDSLQSPDIFADSLRLLHVETKPTIGFTVGIVGNLKLGKYFDLRLVPSLAFGERYLDYYMAAWDESEVSFVEMMG